MPSLLACKVKRARAAPGSAVGLARLGSRAQLGSARLSLQLCSVLGQLWFMPGWALGCVEQV